MLFTVNTPGKSSIFSNKDSNLFSSIFLVIIITGKSGVSVKLS